MRVEKIGVLLASLVEFGGICGLAYIGLKRNNDCYKAECRAINAEYKEASVQIDNIVKDAQIRQLEKELDEMKTKYCVDEKEEA